MPFWCKCSNVTSLGYYDWTNFHHYIEEITQNDMFQFIKKLSMCGLSTKIYKQRALILNKYIIPVNRTMNCAYNISNLVTKYLLKDEFSFSRNITCHNCQYV